MDSWLAWRARNRDDHVAECGEVGTLVARYAGMESGGGGLGLGVCDLISV